LAAHLEGGVSRVPLGPIVESLGIKANLADNDQITDMVILAKVIDAESGATGLGVYHNDIDWITQLGLLMAAVNVFERGDFEQVEDE
jgi:hypothetical protein